MAEHDRMQIQDMDNYEPEGEVVYSHQSLIMKGMKRVYELGGLELHEGVDVKEIVGNKIVVVHKPNERIQFINAIKILRSGISCDFDKEIKDNLKELDKKLIDDKTKLLKIQLEEWSKLSDAQKNDIGVPIIYNNLLNRRLPFFNQFKEVELLYYRSIFEEVVALTHRMGFYSTDMVTM